MLLRSSLIRICTVLLRHVYTDTLGNYHITYNSIILTTTVFLFNPLQIFVKIKVEHLLVNVFDSAVCLFDNSGQNLLRGIKGLSVHVYIDDNYQQSVAS